MIRSRTPALVLALAAALVAPLARPARSAPAPTLVTLRNGLRVVLAPDSAATAVDVAVWYASGAGAEPADQAGIRHVVERLLFRGAPGAEPAARLAAEGATVGSATTPDFCDFYDTVPAEALGLALRLEAERMTPGSTPPAAFEDARRMAMADLRARAARPPVARALARLGALVFEGTPYARASEGDEASLARLTPQKVDAWRRTRVVPANAALTLVGRFDPEPTLALVRRAFEGLPRGSASPQPPALKPLTAGGRLVQRTDTPARLLLVGWRVPGVSDPDGPALELLAAALGSTPDSRFARSLVVDWKLAVVAQCGLDRHAGGSMLWSLSALAPDADSSTAERVVLDEVGTLARGPLDAPEFDRIRAQLLTSELFRMQTARARGQALGEAVMLSGDAAAAGARLDGIARLTPADLQRVAQRALGTANRCIVWFEPPGGNP